MKRRRTATVPAIGLDLHRLALLSSFAAFVQASAEFHHGASQAARLKQKFHARVKPSQTVINPKAPLASSPVNALNATDSDPRAVAALAHGRYGHGSVYLHETNQVLFLGGQVGSTGTYITNDVVVLDLDEAYPSASNPRSISAYSQGLPPHAWAATSVDTDQNVWVIGGVTQDCAADGLTTVLKGSDWTTANPTGHVPPRRRQAQAVAVSNSSSLAVDETQFWVWGGIAEPYTCSLDTVGYMGMDMWSTISRSIATYSWASQVGKTIPKDYRPPVSDYAAVLLRDGVSIAFIGGQVAQGDLAEMDQILTFDTVERTWSLKVRSRSL